VKRSDLKVGDHVLVSDQIDWLAWSNVQRHEVVRLAVPTSRYGRTAVKDREEVKPGDPGYGKARVHTRRLNDDGTPSGWSDGAVTLRSIKGPWAEMKAQHEEVQARMRADTEREQAAREDRERDATALRNRVLDILGRPLSSPYATPSYVAYHDRFEMDRDDLRALVARVVDLERQVAELSGEGRVHQDRT